MDTKTHHRANHLVSLLQWYGIVLPLVHPGFQSHQFADNVKALTRKAPIMGEKRQSVTPLVLQYLYKNADIQISVRDIAKDVNRTIDQVQASLNHLISRANINVECIARGQLYIYHSDPKSTPKATKLFFEEVGRSKRGLVIQDEKGTLYVAEEL